MLTALTVVKSCDPMSVHHLHESSYTFSAVKKIHDEKQSRKVSTFQLQKTLFTRCSLRGDDDPWTSEVCGRLNCCTDLVAEEPVYHVYCYMRFMIHKKLNADWSIW
jgi:hypothetical protein